MRSRNSGGVSLPDSTDDISETGSTISQVHNHLDNSSSQPQSPNTRGAGYSGQTIPGDINTAAALRAQYAIETPKASRRRHKKMTTTTTITTAITTTHTQSLHDEDDDILPLVDNTTPIPLHSKKTDRLQRKQQKRSEKIAYQQSTTPSLLNLPNELFFEVLTHLSPTDLSSLLLTSRHLSSQISHHESLLANNLLRTKYWSLYRCFPLPLALSSVPQGAHAALLSPRRQEMLNIHRKPYQHVSMIDPHEVCTCLTCVFAWNNLCLIVDLHHWQRNLENREPLPMIERGRNPEWNAQLVNQNAGLVRQAMARPMAYVRILELHLDTIRRSIVRASKWRKWIAERGSFEEVMSTRTRVAHTAGVKHVVASTAVPLPIPSETLFSPSPNYVTETGSVSRLYDLTPSDVQAGTDEFLEREGPPSYEFPYMRDHYYDMVAYMPNRKWSDEQRKWFYYPLMPTPHERDLEWVRSWAMGVGWRG